MIINPDINIEVDLLCDSCGKGLIQTDENSTDELIVIKVEVCEHCRADIYADGHTTGFDKGFDDGMKMSDDAINTQIKEGLKDFDFDDLFKKSDKYESLYIARSLIKSENYNQAIDLLEELLS